MGDPGAPATTFTVPEDTTLTADFGYRPAASFSEWEHFFVGDDEASDPVLGGPEGDYNADGTHNVLDYALRRDPLTQESVSPPTSTVFYLSGGHDWLSLEFPLPVDPAADLDLSVWQSTGLDAWQRIAHRLGTGSWEEENGGQIQFLPLEGGGQTIRAISTLNEDAAPAGYLQLRATVSPSPKL